ncbi:MAG: hypothetical protein HN790_04605 [Methylococcales bacterium]|jgi:hypothetical protein|nr:hypothetical protein [Methylococcales bacterium]
MKNVCACALGFVCLLAGNSAYSDEVWNSTYGQVVFEDESGPTATWSYTHNGRPGLIYILGLAGIYSERDRYDGYWVQDASDVRCNTPRLGLNKQKSYFWGNFQVKFIDSGYPARWEGLWGYCNDKPTRSWNGTPQ